MTVNNVIALIEEVTLPEPDVTILLEGRSTPPKFPLTILGPILSKWTSDAACGAGSPVDYVAGSLLAVGSALIGNSRRIAPWSSWKEPAALWIGLVGDPSSGKSPSLDPMLSVIRVIEKDMADAFEDEYKKWEKDLLLSQCAKKKWEDDVVKAYSSKGHVPAKPEEANEPPESVRPRILVSDSSSEKLGLLLSVHNKGLLNFRDELSGWVGSFDRYGGKGADRAFWIESYGGRFYTIDRVKHQLPIRIPYLLSSIMGGIQPDRLSGLMNGADDGLVSRFLWFWPSPIPPFRPYIQADHELILEAMKKLSGLTVSSEAEAGPRIISLEKDAADFFEKWREAHYVDEQNVSGLLKSSYGKAPGHLLRLALNLEFLWWSAKPEEPEPEYIKIQAIEAAAMLVDSYFKPMAERVFGDAAIPEEQRLMATLARYIVKTKPTLINVRDVYRNAHLEGLRKADKVNVAIQGLIEANWLFPLTPPTGGRPRSDYRVSPKLWEVLR